MRSVSILSANWLKSIDFRFLPEQSMAADNLNLGFLNEFIVPQNVFSPLSSGN
jgi:hypothetical protein